MTSWKKGTGEKKRELVVETMIKQHWTDSDGSDILTGPLNSWRLNLCLFNEANVLFIDFLPFMSVTHNYSVVSMRWSWHLAPPWHTQFTKKTHIYPYPSSFLHTNLSPHTNCTPFLWHTFRTGGRTKSLLFARVTKNATLIPQVVSPW